MADRTESSIVIDAPPGEVLDVIADFEAYPEWAGEVKAVRVLAEEGDGWADQVEFTLDAGAIKDTYVLDYEWDVVEDGTGVVSWALVSAQVLKAMDGSYTLAAQGDRHEGHLPARGRRQDPDDRPAQAQGREGHRRHRSQGAQEAGRGLTDRGDDERRGRPAASPPRPDAPPDQPPRTVAEEAALLVDLLSRRGWGAGAGMPSASSRTPR